MATDTQALTIKEIRYPALAEIASQVSQRAQKKFLRLVAADLLCLIAGAILSALSICDMTLIWSKALVAGMGLSFGASLFLTIVLGKKQYKKLWYNSRGIAESVRTLAWRYMTCTGAYSSELTLAEADNKLTEAISALILERKQSAWILGTGQGANRQLPPDMQRLRQMDTQTRKQNYLTSRLEDQIVWYGNKAKFCQQHEDRWFLFIIIAQFLAFASAMLYPFVFSWLHINLISIFATLTTVFFSWSQVKRYQELAQTYGLAAQQLGLLSAKAEHIKTDVELSALVQKAEEIMGREHELWEALGDTP